MEVNCRENYKASEFRKFPFGPVHGMDINQEDKGVEKQLCKRLYDAEFNFNPNNLLEAFQRAVNVLRDCAKRGPLKTDKQVSGVNVQGDVEPADDEPPVVTDDTAPNESETPVDDPTGWKFVSGKAMYNGNPIIVRGKKWQILKVLVNSKTPVLLCDLIDEVWPGDNDLVEAKTVRSHLSGLRNKLREDLALNYDPLPNVERGDNVAWQIDEKLR